MTTPEETRDRIKEMRERIFQVSGEDSVETKTKETSNDNELVEKKSEVAKKNELPSTNVKLTNSPEDSFSENPELNYDRIFSLSADTQKQISKLALEFTNKSSSLETDLLCKLEQTFTESNSEINRIENLVNDNIAILSQKNEAFREELKEFSRSLQLDINSITKRLSAADEKIETNLQNSVNTLSKFENAIENQQNSLKETFFEKLQQNGDRISSLSADTQKQISEIALKIETNLQNSIDKLSKFENAVEDRQNSIEETFSEKLQQNGDRISSLSADTQRQISEVALEFTNKSNTLETEILDKFEHISFHLGKVEEQIENQINDLSGSLQKYVLSITSSQEDKIDTQAKKIQQNVTMLKQEIFEYQRDLKSEFDKKVKESEIKTNNYFSKKISDVRDQLSNEIKSLSAEIKNLNEKTKEKHSELTKHINSSVSSIEKSADKDRKNSNKQFEKVADKIDSAESLIVKEEDLIELFQNYTLNVNISNGGQS